MMVVASSGAARPGTVPWCLGIHAGLTARPWASPLAHVPRARRSQRLESFTGLGNVPAFTRRHSVADENGTGRDQLGLANVARWCSSPRRGLVPCRHTS